MMSSISLNGDRHPLDAPVRLETLLEGLGYSGSFAVAVNREFVPRPSYGTTTIQPGDEIDVIAPMQGG